MYSELKNVELPLIKTLVKLGWKYISSSELDLMRKSWSNPFVTEQLKTAILKLNSVKGVSGEIADAIINKLKKIDDNEEFHCWLKGERTYKPSPDSMAISITLIDENITNNDFVVTNQFVFDVTNPVNTSDKHIRADVVLLVNGIPITIIECKVLSTEGSTYSEGIRQLARYQQFSPQLFIPNVFNISTDGHILKYGATGAPAQYYLEWKHDAGTPEEFIEDSEFKRYRETNEQSYNPYIDKQIFSLLTPKTFIDLITNFVLYETRDNTTVKKIARYQQFRAVNKIVDRVLKGEMKTGLIWHTQGSGKSLTMLFASWKLRKQKQLKNPTILIVVDRIDLDDQISGTFTAAKLPNTTRAGSIAQLRQKLEEDRREVIITTVFKFSEMQDVLIHRDNIILLIDEAHRSQEGLNAVEMRSALPNAFFFGFTGTPIDKFDRNTHRNFGLMPDKKTIERYLDLYSIKQAIDDGATVPVHYQLRNSKWHLLDEDIDKVIDEEYKQLDEESLNVLKEKASSYATFMTLPERLDDVANDLAEHYKNHIEPNGFKAQVVCYTRTTCVEMKNRLDRILGEKYSEIVFSGGMNDEDFLRKHHKSKEEIKNVILKFGQKDSELKLLIVQNMLLTGFDAPVEQAMYLDRPLKDHSLLQAIARTNRPYPNKPCGIIIDYCGVLRNLKKALNFDESDIEKCLIDFDELKKKLPLNIEYFFSFFKGINLENLWQCTKHMKDNNLDDKVFAAFKELELSYEVLTPDPFVLPYTNKYQTAAQIVLARKQQINQRPDINEYLAHTRELIQEHIDISKINNAAPVFVVDDKYLHKLGDLGLTKEQKEMTLEEALRKILIVKGPTMPIYKSLLERLQRIIDRKNVETEDTLSLLEKLTNEVNEAIKKEKSLGYSKGELAIYQLLTEKIKDEELLKKTSAELNDIILAQTKDFKDWQLQDSVKARIKRDVIIALATASRQNKNVNISPDEYSNFVTELLKYVEIHY